MFVPLELCVLASQASFHAVVRSIRCLVLGVDFAVMANQVGVEERQILCDVNDFEVTGVIGYDPTDAIVTVLLGVICFVKTIEGPPIELELDSRCLYVVLSSLSFCGATSPLTKSVKQGHERTVQA